jgi:hypothetical protein
MEVFRLITKQKTGTHLDTGRDMSLAEFGGVAPMPGDLLVEAAWTAELPSRTEVSRVVSRVFHGGLVALICERAELPADLVTALGLPPDTLQV